MRHSAFDCFWGVSAFALGVNQAGWRHRLLIVSLFSISGVFALGAIFYPSLSLSWPDFTVSLNQMASNAWVWFGLVIFLALYLLIWPIRVSPKPQQHSTTSTVSPVLIHQQSVGEKIRVVAAPWQDLVALCADRTDVEVQHIIREHAGELFECSGVVFDVRTTNEVSATISIDPDPMKSVLIHARISGKDRVMSAISLRKGDKLKVSGKIAEISRVSISLTDCEFVRV